MVTTDQVLSFGAAALIRAGAMSMTGQGVAAATAGRPD
jgi:hypothetical protein